MPRIKLEGVSKSFGKITALEQVNFEMQDGEYITILGPSGCGKTTLIKIVAGIWTPTEGRVLVDNKDITNTPMEERDLGYVFQNIILFPHMNVKDNTGYSPRVKGLSEKQIEERSSSAMELVGVLEQQGYLPNELSGGAQQKASLARAIASKARLLLLDEPLSALDARVTVELRYALRRLVKDLNLTAIHVTHDQDEAMSVADRVVIMRKGKIVEIGEPTQLYNQPRTLFTANFVGQSNFLEGTVQLVENGNAAVELRGERLLKVANTGFSIGDPVVLAIRPEHLTLSPEERPNTLRSKIEESRFMGPYTRYRLRAETGDELLVDLPTTEAKAASSIEVILFEDLSKGELEPKQREALMRLVLRIDDISQNTKQAGLNLELIAQSKKRVPKEFWSMYKDLSKRFVAQTGALRSAIEAFGHSDDDVLKRREEVKNIEQQIDDAYFNLRKKLILSSSGPLALLVLMDVLTWVESASDRAKDAADMLYILVMANR